jgi:hypothetical protein
MQRRALLQLLAGSSLAASQPEADQAPPYRVSSRYPTVAELEAALADTRR